MPTSASTTGDAMAYERGEPEGKIRGSRGGCSGSGCANRTRVLAVVEQLTQFTAVSSIKHVDSVLVHLKTGLDDMLSVRVTQIVIELNHGRSEVLQRDRVAYIGQSPGARLRNGATGKAEQGKAS